MLDLLLFLLIIAPMLLALLCLIPSGGVRTVAVLACACLLIAASIALVLETPFHYAAETCVGMDLSQAVQWADLALLGLFLIIGLLRRSIAVILLALAQLGLIIWLEFFLITEHHVAHLMGDNLALLMVLIVSVVGSLICVYALPYMRKHGEHHKVPFGDPRFFAVLLLFLGAMNGLVLAGDLSWLYFFFELTTLCSYLLIGHDRTEEAVHNAVRALWMNSLGGLAFAGALVLAFMHWETLEVARILEFAPQAPMYLLPLALLCLAGMVKAAQLPFQSWLLGAMVAPTPTSALLHSSTMVKAGIYMVLRLAPGIHGTMLGDGVALVGGFTFFAAGALAVGQSNGKRVLAYSTISNLGLILACAGINTPAAIIAAMLLTAFHAVSKGLLFCCVGAVEQEIGSRDVEDMRDLYGRMPVTALLAVLGILAMILPPFGMLVGKWLALAAAMSYPMVLLLLVLGSALTVVYWTRWAGGLLGSSGADRPPTEPQAFLMRSPLVLMTLMAVALGLAAPWLYTWLEFPVVRDYNALPHGEGGWVLMGGHGLAMVYPLYGLAALGLLCFLGRNRVRSTPYLSGVQTEEPDVYIGPANESVRVEYANYYLAGLFGEQRLTLWLNMLAVGLLAWLVAAAQWQNMLLPWLLGRVYG
ncbi:MAG: NADH-quinone oxidoreductase subunit L [Desulfovibrio sp.]|nr:MAG: NADH-quinone oxidoreductase subunit L [Desulfovibrio sp.]